MREHPRHVPKADARTRGVKRRHRHLIEQVAEKGRLGEHLDIEEIRAGLERHFPKPLRALEPAGGVDVDRRRREHPAPRRAREEAPRARPPGRRSASQHVIASIDRLQQRIEMTGGPALPSPRDQRQRTSHARERPLERRGSVVAHHDDQFRFAPALREQRANRPSHGLRALPAVAGEHNDRDRRARNRLTLHVRFKRVEELIAGR